MTAAVSVSSVSKSFKLARERNQTMKSALLRGRTGRFDKFDALHKIDLDIEEGSSFALIGGNGSGKSTLLKIMANILQPSSGRVRVNGRMAALLELGSGFHPELSGRENIRLNATILGLQRREIEKRMEEIIDFSGIEKFIDQPVKVYSSGMYLRLAFSVATSVDADVLLIDEILSVGDLAFQEKSFARFRSLLGEGKTVVLVTHALQVVLDMCDSAALLNGGRLVTTGTPRRVIERYSALLHGDAKKEDHDLGLRITDVIAHSTPAGNVGVRLTISRSSAGSKAAVAIALLTDQGLPIFDVSTREQELFINELSDRVEVSLVTSPLSLPYGQYQVRAAVHSADEPATEAVKRATVTTFYHPGFGRSPNAILYPSVSWDVVGNSGKT